MKEIADKIVLVEQLPSYEEVKELLVFLDSESEKFLDQWIELRGQVRAPTMNQEVEKRKSQLNYLNKEQWYHQSWKKFCRKNGIWQVYTKEFVDLLAGKIHELNSGRIIEICAGKGKLSYHLQKRDIEIIATDDYSWKDTCLSPKNVECLSAKEAIKKYKPNLVVASWIPNHLTIGFEILDDPEIDYFINIGEDVGNSTWMTGEVDRTKGIERILLEEIADVGFCSSDFYDVPYNPSDLNEVQDDNLHIFHTSVSLFNRINSQA